MRVFNQNGELEQDAVDVLYELGNVGVGIAVMAIGNLRRMEIHIDPPGVITIKENIFAEIDYDPEQIAVGISTRMDNILNGSLLFLLGREFIRNTVFEMTGEKFNDSELLENEDSFSAIKEMINYMTAGYARVIGEYLNGPVYISPAAIGMNQARVLVQEAMEHTGAQLHKIACVNTLFTIVDEDGNKTNESGRVLIFPDEACIEKFMEIMGE